MHTATQSANRFLGRSPLVALVTCLVAVATVGASGTAHAKGRGKPQAPPKVGVLTFTGPGEAASRASVDKALRSRKITVVSASELTAAARSAHVKLDSNDGFRAVSKALDLTAVVTGEVSKKKATIVVHTGDDGSVVGEETFQGADPRKVAATVHKTFWKRLAGAFNKTKPPSGGNFEAPPPEEEPASAGEAEATNEPAPTATRNTDEAPPAARRAEKKKAAQTAEAKSEGGKEGAKTAEESEAASGAPEVLDVMGGAAWFMRSLSFNQPRNDLSNTKVASYSLPRAPALFLRADLFPAALAGMDGFAADVGLTLDLAYLLPVVKSAGMDGEYKTYGLAYAGGLKVRLPAGIFATVAYGDQTFKLTRTNSNMAYSVVPGVNYKYVRIGAGIRSQVTSSLMLQANLGFLQCLGKPGDIASSSYFPRTTCNGFEAGAVAGYRLAPEWELRAGIDWRRFGMNFHVKSSDVQNDPAATPPIAGGGVDQFTQIYLGIAYIMGGGGSSESHETKSSEGDKADKKADKKAEDDDDSEEGGE